MLETTNKLIILCSLCFRKLLESETKILNDKCIQWNEKLNYRTDIPETIQGDIGSVIGKTKMLTSDKFKQFQELIDKFNKMDPMIKINDLQGFWEWMLLDVDKMHEEFFKLSKLEENKWMVEEEKQNVKKVVKKMPVVKKTVVKPKGVSNIRAHILGESQLGMRKTLKKTYPCSSIHLSFLRGRPSLNAGH